MSNLVAAVAAYLPPLLPTPESVVRAFASVGEKRYSAEWVASQHTTPKSGDTPKKTAKRRQASAYRALQKYGLRGGAKGAKKVTREPDKDALARMRRIIYARDFPAQIRVHGHIGYSESDMRIRTITVSMVVNDTGGKDPIGPEYLRIIVNVAHAVDEGQRVTHHGGKRVAVGGDGDGDFSGETIAHNVFTGAYWQEERPTDIRGDGGRLIARTPYHEQLRYDADCVFTVSKVRD